MHLIQRMIAPASELPESRQVILSAERRQLLKRRWRAIADDGTEFGFDLVVPLADGGLIFQQDGKDYIIRQLPELVYEVVFESPAHAAMVAWRVGNLRLPSQILEDRIRVLHDEAMSHLIGFEGWAFSEPEVLFRPLMTIGPA